VLVGDGMADVRVPEHGIAGHYLQRIGLTATVGNPEEMLVWLARGRGGLAIGPTRPPTEGEVTADYVGSLANAVTVLARVFRGERRLVFAESRSRVEQVTEGLRATGVRTFASHASLSLNERRAAEAAFTAEPDCVDALTFEPQLRRPLHEVFGQGGGAQERERGGSIELDAHRLVQIQFRFYFAMCQVQFV